MDSTLVNSHKILIQPLIINIHNKAVFKKITYFLEKNQCFGQLIPISTILNIDHIKMAVFHVLNNFELKSSISSSKSMELLLKLYGENQISRIINKMQIEEGKENEMLLIIVGKENCKKVLNYAMKEFDLKPKNKLWEKNRIKSVANFFEINETDENIILKEIMERIAFSNISN